MVKTKLSRLNYEQLHLLKLNNIYAPEVLKLHVNLI